MGPELSSTFVNLNYMCSTYRESTVEHLCRLGFAGYFNIFKALSATLEIMLNCNFPKLGPS